MLSIVIPTYDQPHYLQESLTTLVDQLSTTVDYEIVVVDNSAQYNKNVELISSIIKYIHASDYRNPYTSRNFGANFASGETLLFLDSKSLVGDTFASTLKGKIISNEYDIIGGEISVVCSSEDSLFSLAHAVCYLRTNPKYFRGRPSALTTNMLLKKSVWEALGGFKETRSGNDVEFIARARAAGYKVAYDPDLLVHYPAKSPAEVIQFLKRIAKNGQNKVGLLSLRPPRPGPINMRLKDIGVKLSIWRWVQLYFTIWYVRFLKFYYQYI